jgi:hypothetical protein
MRSSYNNDCVLVKQSIGSSIKSYRCSLSELPVTVSTHLFDSLVRPILTYNCEIWNMDTYKAHYNVTLRATKSNSQFHHFESE